MRYTTLLSLILIIFSCNNQKQQEKKIGDYYVKANFINDTIMDGLVYFFDIANHRLTSVVNYKNGLKHGFSVNYYSNGKVYDSLNYANGLQNGKHFVYDSLGSLAYQDFYFYNQQLGPEFFYKNGNVNAYYFTSFEKYQVFNSMYDSTGNLIKNTGKFINASIYQANIDGMPADGIFSYFIYPPQVNISYELIERGTNNKSENLIKKLHDQVFLDTIMSKPKPNSVYCIKATIKDSIGVVNRLFYEDLINE